MKMILLSALAVLMLNANTSTPAKNTLPRTSDPVAQQNADSQLKIQNREIIRLVVEEIGKTLPLKIDDYTMYTSIKADDLTLVSTYEINTGAKSDEAVRNNDKKRMEGFIVEGICQSSKRFLEGDINITYVYISKNTKAELFRFPITPKDCSSFWRK